MEEIKIIRVEKDLHSKAKDVSKKAHMTLSGFTETALKKLIEEYEFNYSSLMELIEKTPRLALYKSIIEKEFKGAPRELVKDVMKLIKFDHAIFYKVRLKEEEYEKIGKIFNKPFNKVIIIAKIGQDDEEEVVKTANKISELMGEMKTNQNDFKLSIKKDFEMKGKDSELLIFISYKDGLKKEGKNGR